MFTILRSEAPPGSTTPVVAPQHSLGHPSRSQDTDTVTLPSQCAPPTSLATLFVKHQGLPQLAGDFLQNRVVVAHEVVKSLGMGRN